MIDLNLDRQRPAAFSTPVREEALVARNYARYYDENEHEFPPDELPEAQGSSRAS